MSNQMLRAAAPRPARSRRSSLWPWMPVLSTAAALSVLLVMTSPLPLH